MGQRRERGTVAAYTALFLLGAMQGLIGCFQFSHSLAGVPVMSLAFCALILATIVAGAVGMGTALGGVLPGDRLDGGVVRADPADRGGQRHRHEHHRGRVVSLRRRGLRGSGDRGQLRFAAAAAQC